MRGKTRYDCTENDNHLYIHCEQGEIDEILVGDPLEKDWTVIGFKDLKAALASQGYDVLRVRGQLEHAP